jgi:hypothetical protein
MSEPARVAFKLGGFKRPVVNTIASSALKFDSSSITNNDQPELVTGFDNGEIKSNTLSVPKVELVIPAQPNAHHQFFKLKTSLRKAAAISNTTVANDDINQLNDDARRALILEAQEANEAWDDRNENGVVRVHTIEQD